MGKPQHPTDAEFIQHPGLWPMWPLLPLKRTRNTSSGLPETGVIIEEETKFRVYHCSMFTTITPSTPHTDYPTVNALLADGWVVD